MRKMNIKILIGCMLGLSLFSISGCLSRLIDYVPLTVVYDLVANNGSGKFETLNNIEIIGEKEELITCIETYEFISEEVINNFTDSYFNSYYIILRMYIGGGGTLNAAELDGNTIIFHSYYTEAQDAVVSYNYFPVQIEKDLVDIETLEVGFESLIVSNEDFNSIHDIENVVLYY